MITKQETNKMIEEDFQRQARNGDFNCHACLAELKPFEKVIDFGGILCEECQKDVEKHLKILEEGN